MNGDTSFVALAYESTIQKLLRWAVAGGDKRCDGGQANVTTRLYVRTGMRACVGVNGGCIRMCVSVYVCVCNVHVLRAGTSK